MSITLYHNPRCSKSRAALALLEGRGVTPHVVRYLETPPGADEIRALLARLGIRPRDLMRRKEAPYAELGLDDDGLGDDALVEAIAAHPILLERPIAVNGPRAVVGRPPERVLEIL